MADITDTILRAIHREYVAKHREGNVLGFCGWCGICLDCRPHHDGRRCREDAHG